MLARLAVPDHVWIIGFIVAGLLLAVVELARTKLTSLPAWAIGLVAVGVLVLVR